MDQAAFKRYRDAVNELTAASKALQGEALDWKAATERFREAAQRCADARRALGGPVTSVIGRTRSDPSS